MAGINTAGTSSSSNYVIGRGCVFISPLDSNDNPVAWREIGNTTDLEIEADTSVIEHFSSKSTTRVKDAEVISELSLDFSLTLEELTYENYAEFFLGDARGYTDPSSNVGVTGEFAFPNFLGSAQDPQPMGRYYGVYFDGADMFIGTDADNANTHNQKVYGLVPANIEITDGVNTWVGGTHFDYDPVSGDIFIAYDDSGLNGAPAAGSLQEAMLNAGITATASGPAYVRLDMEYTAAFGGTRYDEMVGLSASQKNVAIKILQVNANQAGETNEIVIHKCKLRPQGTLGFIQDEDFGSLPLEGSLESNTSYDSAGGGFVTIRRVQVPA